MPVSIIMSVMVAVLTIVSFHFTLTNFPFVRRTILSYGKYVDAFISIGYWFAASGGGQGAQLSAALIGLFMYGYVGKTRQLFKATQDAADAAIAAEEAAAKKA